MLRANETTLLAIDTIPSGKCYKSLWANALLANANSPIKEDLPPDIAMYQLLKLVGLEWFMRWRIRIRSKMMTVISLVLFIYIILTTLPAQRVGQVWNHLFRSYACKNPQNTQGKVREIF